MPFDRPTPQEILQRIQSEIDIALPGADTRIRRSVEGVIARVLAMASHEMYGFLDWNSRQILPDTAESEFLERHASLWGITRKSASAATGTAQFSGTNGSVIPADSALVRNDDVSYTLDADITIAAGTGSGSVTAVSGGADGNAVAGTKLRLSSPVAGVVSEGAALSDLEGGADSEDDEALRARVIARIRQPPHGGAAFDYINWALEVPGVTRAWVWPEQYGTGTLAVTFVMDDQEGGIIPSAPDVAAVQAHIDGLRPVTADPTVFAPTAVPVDFEIHLNPNSSAVQAAVQAEIEDLFLREAEPGGTLYLSRINEAISTAAGEFDHVLVSPAANITPSFGQIPTVGSFTWAGL